MIVENVSRESQFMPLKSPRSDIAYHVLRRAIVEQALRPGTKLPEDEIGEHFGMSRTPVRATFNRLQAEGLVEARPKRTVIVARPSLEEAKDIFEVRKALEQNVVALVIERWRPDHGPELEGHVREENAARARHDDPLSIRLAGEFHCKLAAMTGNRLLERYVGEVVSRCSLILALYGRPHSTECAVNEHSQIIAALRAGDARVAADLMNAHVGSVERRALLSRGADEYPGLGAILSRYAVAAEAEAHAIALPRRAEKRSR
jgi:DNA-binding GntR family transcriptional regulator